MTHSSICDKTTQMAEGRGPERCASGDRLDSADIRFDKSPMTVTGRVETVGA